VSHPRQPDSARVGEILPLTGLRIVAALLVVFFHIRGNIWTEFPGATRYLNPILEHGDLGVDLFFALSGFVLTLNYLDRLGNGLTRRNVGRFVWARLARVWPAYFVTLNIAAVWHGTLMATGSHNPVEPDEFTVWSYLRQATLVVLWTEDDFDRLTWNGPAWSVSAEALVYLLFPLIVLLLPRLARVLRARQLMALGAIAMFPAVLFALVAGSIYLPDLWLLRLLGAFLSGCMACLVARRIRRGARASRLGSMASAGIVAVIVAVCYVTHLLDRNVAAFTVVLLFGPLLVALAVSDRGVSRVLSTRAAVFGGHISYSVYLVHMLLIEPLWWSQSQWPSVLAPGEPLFRVLLFSMPVIVCFFGWLLWRYVEEPARKAMRAMQGQPPTPVAPPLNPPALPANGVPVADTVPATVGQQRMSDPA
jgi:peptidoglycan/LPS O-acetylase OafA/YrhL